MEKNCVLNQSLTHSHGSFDDNGTEARHLGINCVKLNLAINKLQ